MVDPSENVVARHDVSRFSVLFVIPRERQARISGQLKRTRP